LGYDKDNCADIQPDVTVNDEADTPVVDEEQVAHEQRHADKIKMRLAVMGHKTGQRLDKDIYFGEKTVARAGAPITRVMVERLRELDPVKIHFTTGGQRRLNID